jgi:hypothetical protein
MKEFDQATGKCKGFVNFIYMGSFIDTDVRSIKMDAELRIMPHGTCAV